MNKKDYETPLTMVIELKIESLLNTISQGGNDTPSDSRSGWWDDENDEED